MNSFIMYRCLSNLKSLWSVYNSKSQQKQEVIISKYWQYSCCGFQLVMPTLVILTWSKLFKNFERLKKRLMEAFNSRFFSHFCTHIIKCDYKNLHILTIYPWFVNFFLSYSLFFRSLYDLLLASSHLYSLFWKEMFFFHEDFRN